MIKSGNLKIYKLDKQYQRDTILNIYTDSIVLDRISKITICFEDGEVVTANQINELNYTSEYELVFTDELINPKLYNAYVNHKAIKEIVVIGKCVDAKDATEILEYEISYSDFYKSLNFKKYTGGLNTDSTHQYTIE